MTWCPVYLLLLLKSSPEKTAMFNLSPCIYVLLFKNSRVKYFSWSFRSFNSLQLHQFGLYHHHHMLGVSCFVIFFSSSWQLIEAFSDKPFSCTHCEKTFASKKSMQNHSRSHTGLTTCAVCYKTFSTVSNLNTHLQHSKHHENESKFYSQQV